MHVSTKKLALLGVLLAIAEVFIILSSVIDVSTFFFLAAASFLVGAAVKESSFSLGMGFYLASVLLAFIIAPNKLYCVTYTGIAGYVIIIEGIKAILMKRNLKQLATLDHSNAKRNHYTYVLWIAKFVVFNILYLLALFLYPRLIYEGEISTIIWIGLFVAGQVVLVIYDLAYDYFLNQYWSRIRKEIK